MNCFKEPYFKEAETDTDTGSKDSGGSDFRRPSDYRKASQLAAKMSMYDKFQEELEEEEEENEEVKSTVQLEDQKSGSKIESTSVLDAEGKKSQVQPNVEKKNITGSPLKDVFVNEVQQFVDSLNW